MSQIITYTFSTPAASSITITLADTPTNIAASDNSTYQGYVVTGISGSFNGQTITGLLGPGGVESNDANNAGPYDNTIFVDNASGDGGASLNGIDQDGLGFMTATAHYAVYNDGPGKYSFESANVPSQTVTLSSTNEQSVICFAAGTRIATVRGDVLVERLCTGDLAITTSGQKRPVTWIGKGQVLVTRGGRSAATPVIVRKGALGPNVPNSDLHITKAHSLFVDGVLIPVEFLVNHRSIIWDDHAREVQIYHVELDDHDVLLANGAPAESYRDDGNRWLFQNGNTGWEQPPKPSCAPVLTGGPLVDAAWRRFLDRSGPRPGLPLTDDSDLHLVVDGVRLYGSTDGHRTRVFRLPWRPKCVRVVSRAGVPDELGLARDPRMLGVALFRIVLCHPGGEFTVSADDERLSEGFHAFEADNGFRWTDGDAVLPAEIFNCVTKGCELRLEVGGVMQYPLLEAAVAV